MIHPQQPLIFIHLHYLPKNDYDHHYDTFHIYHIITLEANIPLLDIYIYIYTSILLDINIPYIYIYTISHSIIIYIYTSNQTIPHNIFQPPYPTTFIPRISYDIFHNPDDQCIEYIPTKLGHL